MNVTAYADRRRATQRAPFLPRNARVADIARERGVPLVISFVGDTDWPNPTVYANPGRRYDWSIVQGCDTLIAVRPGIDVAHALREIFAFMDVMRAYPALIDVQAEEVSMVVGNNPLQLWPVRRGTGLWQLYFNPAT